MIREAEARRNLALTVFYAHHKPEEINKVFPPTKPSLPEGFVADDAPEDWMAHLNPKVDD